jgi:hypothetical protein
VRGFLPLLVRDLGIAALTAVVLVLEAQAEGLAASVLGVLAGTLAALTAFVIHEWGHLAGALGSGGTAHPAPSLASFFLFHFDVEKSDRRQFLAMSYGGYLATVLAVLLLALWIDPARLSGQTCLVLSVLGIGVTLALEIPTTVRVARGGPLPHGGVYAGTPPA